jgi:hypothetical protein
MNIAYYHASKFGNGAEVAAEFKKVMAANGITVAVQHIRDAKPKDLPKADLTKVAEESVLVTGMKGPLEEGWQQKVGAFAAEIMSALGSQPR